MTAPSPSAEKKWIRGVNIGGWLVLERYIVPYHFSITDCHLSGDLCFFPGALSAPPPGHPDYQLCDVHTCKPILKPSPLDGGVLDFPNDEWHLAQAFQNDTALGAKWLNYHFDNFLTRDDLVALQRAGVTHVRVPLPHWILGNIIEGEEPYIAGDRWKYFVRMCGWARSLGLEVWANLHTAPGSQNGFDNVRS